MYIFYIFFFYTCIWLEGLRFPSTAAEGGRERQAIGAPGETVPAVAVFLWGRPQWVGRLHVLRRALRSPLVNNVGSISVSQSKYPGWQWDACHHIT